DVLGETTVPMHADDPLTRADVELAAAALIAFSARDVRLGGYQISPSNRLRGALSDSAHRAADLDHLTAEFVADDPRTAKAIGRAEDHIAHRAIPVVDVRVGAAQRRRAYSHENVAGSAARHVHVGPLQGTGPGRHLAYRLHRVLWVLGMRDPSLGSWSMNVRAPDYMSTGVRRATPLTPALCHT